jgi:hypothetical protein
MKMPKPQAATEEMIGSRKMSGKMGKRERELA